MKDVLELLQSNFGSDELAPGVTLGILKSAVRLFDPGLSLMRDDAPLIVEALDYEITLDGDMLDEIYELYLLELNTGNIIPFLACASAVFLVDWADDADDIDLDSSVYGINEMAYLIISCAEFLSVKATQDVVDTFNNEVTL